MRKVFVSRKSLIFPKLLRGLFGFLGAGCLLFSLIPMLFYQIYNIGALLLLPAGLFFLGLFLYGDRMVAWRRSGPKRIHRRLFDAAVVVTGTGLFALICVFSLMVKAAYFTPPHEDGATVVVLGCLVRGDAPSQMLQGRLDKALFYLQDHPKSACVVSGGKGSNEEYSEAYVMAKYLTGHGVDPARIFKEEASSDTQENLALSAQLIGREQLSTQVVLVTDDFHMFRCVQRAKENGLSPTCLSSRPPLGLIPCYWLREFFAIGEWALQTLFS